MRIQIDRLQEVISLSEYFPVLTLKSPIRGTQRVFSVNYLFGELNTAYYFFSKLEGGQNALNLVI